LHRGHRVQKASRKAAEAAVPETGVGLLLQHREPIEALVIDHPLHDGIKKQIEDIVGQGAPDQELHREIVNPLGISLLVRLLGPQPSLREDVPHGTGGGLVTLPRLHRRGIDDVVAQEVALVERIARAGEPNRAAPVPLEQPIQRRRA